jgi:hypothetical protein
MAIQVVSALSRSDPPLLEREPHVVVLRDLAAAAAAGEGRLDRRGPPSRAESGCHVAARSGVVSAVFPDREADGDDECDRGARRTAEVLGLGP